MQNYFVMERMGQQHNDEALREADRARLARIAQASDQPDSIWRKIQGRMIPHAAGAREVPGL